MKCLYYLTPDLAGTDALAADLRQLGIGDFCLHVVSKDEFGLKRHRLHSSNYLETMDILRYGFIGAALGCLMGLLGIGLLRYLQPFGPLVHIPIVVYLIVGATATLFGAWEGGLTGVQHENRKLARFHEPLEAGQYLALVYVRQHQEGRVRSMLETAHPEAQLVAVDSHILNPFGRLSRTVEQSASPWVPHPGS